MSSITTILDVQSTRRSREAIFSLAQAKRDLAVDSQLCNRLLKVCRLPRAIPKPVDRLSCLSGLTSRTRCICPATERSSAHLLRGASRRQHRSVTTGETISECCGTLHPQEEPHTSTLKHVLQESPATGKQQLLLGDSGNLRKHLMKSVQRKKPGDQREPYTVYLLVLLNQEAEFALWLFTWH